MKYIVLIFFLIIIIFSVLFKNKKNIIEKFKPKNCPFPNLSKECDRKGQGLSYCNWQYCCPKSFSNSNYGANSTRCGTGVLGDRTSEGWGIPRQACENAGGVVTQVKSSPPWYVCTNKKYIKNIINKAIFGVGSDYKLYSMAMTGGDWTQINMNKPDGSCCINYIKIYKDNIYGIGYGKLDASVSGKLYKWNLNSNSRWMGITNNTQKIKQFDIYNDIIYAIGTNRLLYTRSINGNTWTQANMKVYKPLASNKNTCCIDFIKIYKGDGYILSGNGIAVWKGLSPNTRYSTWLNKNLNMKIKQFDIYNNIIYTVGNRKLYQMPISGGNWTEANMKGSTCCIDFIKIYKGNGYILSGTGIAVWKGLSPNTRYSGPYEKAWLNKPSIKMLQIEMNPPEIEPVVKPVIQPKVKPEVQPEIQDNYQNFGTIKDSSVYNNPVISEEVELTTEKYKFGMESMKFDGRSYLKIKDSEEFNFGSKNFTIEAWIYPNNKQGQNQTIITQSQGGGGNSSWYLGIGPKNKAQVYLGSSNNLSKWDYGYNTIVSKSQIPFNSWTHIALVRYSTELYLFINGIREVKQNLQLNYNIPNSSLPITVGAQSGNQPNYYNGYIDSLRITDYAIYKSNFEVPKKPFTNKPRQPIYIENQPQVVQPEVVQPQVFKPEVVQPEVVQQQVFQSQVVQPEVVQPEVVQPEVVQPQVVQEEIVMKKFQAAYITGANAKIGNYSDNLVSENLRNTISVNTLIDDVENNPLRSADNLLYNYMKQWYVRGVANKKVSAVFTFKYPVDIKYFSYATYNGGSVGAYKGWNLYYKDSNNNWIKSIDNNNTRIYIPSAKWIKPNYGIKVSNSNMSKEWKFEVLPTKDVYIYWVKMYGDYLIPENDVKTLQTKECVANWSKSFGEGNAKRNCTKGKWIPLNYSNNYYTCRSNNNDNCPAGYRTLE